MDAPPPVAMESKQIKPTLMKAHAPPPVAMEHKQMKNVE
jgi:hypothetical protein